MAKTFFTLIGICYCLVSYSQTNTFPSTGAVGIGTTNPIVGKLQIESVDNNVFFAMTGSGNGRLHIGTDAGANVYLRTWNSVDLRFGASGVDYMTLKNSGNFGIGTTSPSQKLEINGTSFITGSGLSGITSTSGTGIYINGNGIYSFAGNNGHDLSIQAKVLTFYSGATYGEKMRLESSGNLGIGTTTPSEKLTVAGNAKINGNVTAKKITVTQLGWSDYVFYDSYHLRSLPDLEKFIIANKHLPDVPSAKEVEERGINVGDNQAVLLKKIEEMTLYMIQMQKEIEVLKNKIK